MFRFIRPLLLFKQFLGRFRDKLRPPALAAFQKQQALAEHALDSVFVAVILAVAIYMLARNLWLS